MATGQSEAADGVPEDEQLGDFLLITDRLYDCYFVVGNSELGPTERTGAVKACLMNQSRVFRNMLHDSHLAERGDIQVPDIQPPIFRLLLKTDDIEAVATANLVKLCDQLFELFNGVNKMDEGCKDPSYCITSVNTTSSVMKSKHMLATENGMFPLQFELFVCIPNSGVTHCYGGLENCRSLTPEITVKLCYVAEKYLMSSLKRKVAERLKPECATDIFPGLHCLVTYNVTDLENHITEIIREQTDKVLASEGFLDIDVNSLVFIVKQDILNCPEIDIWRAVVKWATHKAQNEEGTLLRDWMAQPLKHLRLMTLSYEDLCKEVLPANILTYEEFCQICARSEQESKMICTKTENRGVFQERWKWWETVTVTHEGREQRWAQSDQSYSCLVVSERSIMLESVSCLGSTTPPFQDCYGLSYPCQAEIIISRITDYISSTSTEEPVVVKFVGTANYFELLTIPTLVNGESITLKANSMYKLKMSFVSADPCLHPCWRAPTCSDGHTFSHGKFYCSYIYEDGIGWKPSHVVKFQYSYRR